MMEAISPALAVEMAARPGAGSRGAGCRAREERASVGIEAWEWGGRQPAPALCVRPKLVFAAA